MLIGRYGEPARDLGPFDMPDWQEFMHYLYLPVRLPASEGAEGPSWSASVALPPRLDFLRDAVMTALADAQEFDHLSDPYVYVSAKRGMALPGAPGNRPGWHTDDFGGTDVNYVWANRFPTRQLTSARPLPIPPNDRQSMVTMEKFAATATTGLFDDLQITNLTAGSLWRLTPWVVHDTPIVPKPGGMRSFLKISVSDKRYDLVGNSHNYELDYDWPMRERGEVRNHQPRAVVPGRDDVEELTIPRANLMPRLEPLP